MYKLHVIAHTFLRRGAFGPGDHLCRQVAKNDMVSAFGHFYRRLTFTAASIENAQFFRSKAGKQDVQILPEDRLTQLALGRAINIAGKLFRDVIKIAIPHWESSTR